MKEKFKDKEFTPRVMAMIEEADRIITRYMAMGYDLSTRQIFYQFVSKKVLVDGKPFANTDRNYQNLQAIIAEGRVCGLLDWEGVRDRNRITHALNTHDSMRECLQEVNDGFRRNKWKTQPSYVEVMVEKQALEGILIPLCERWEVPFTANKGYSSDGSLYQRGKYIQSMRDVEGKDVHVIYLGDHDPSGVDMTRDVLERLSLYSDGPVNVHRVALTIEQVEDLKLPPDPAKVSDSRAAAYIERYGESSWELDAIEPELLVSLVEGKIRELVHPGAWETALKQQESEQNTLQDLIETNFKE